MEELEGACEVIDPQQLDQICGMSVCTQDGKVMGSVEAVYLDEAGEPEWALVNTGWFGHRSSFVPLNEAHFDAEVLTVPYDEETIRKAPTVEPESDLSKSHKAELYAAYGLPHRRGLHTVSYCDVFPSRKIWTA